MVSDSGSTSREVIAFVAPHSLDQWLIYILTAFFIIYIIRYLVHSHGKFKIGSLFSYEPEIIREVKTDLIEPLMKDLKEDHQEFRGHFDRLRGEVQKSLDDRKALHDKINLISDDLLQLRKESIKTQILLDETPHERKLFLYDVYKELGGNSWMDLWMEEYLALKKRGGEQ